MLRKRLKCRKWFDVEKCSVSIDLGDDGHLYKTRKGSWLHNEKRIDEAKAVRLLLAAFVGDDAVIPAKWLKESLAQLEPRIRKIIEAARRRYFDPKKEI
jgi:hypothetical protein